MPELNFFKKDDKHEASVSHYCESDDILKIFDATPENSLLILDIDDTIGRLPHLLGIDPWFIHKIQVYIAENFSPDEAKEKAVALYTAIQLISWQMVPLNKNINIGQAIQVLKARGIKVIALTARNHHIKENTHQQLASIEVSFSHDMLKDERFMLEDKCIDVEKGIIFCSGANKGNVLAAVKDKLLSSSPKKVISIDDNHKNCQHILSELTSWNVDHLVCHYQYQEKHMRFTDDHKKLTLIQEQHFLIHNEILSDDHAQQRFDIHRQLEARCKV